MKWTQSVNENVMRAYYGSTEGGTNLTAYRVRMLSLFQDLDPTVDVSAQRLSDQVRVIQRNHRLDDTALDRLRSEVVDNLTNSTPTQTVVQAPASGAITPRLNNDSVEGDDRVVTVSSQCNDRLRSALEDALREYRSTPTELRPRLPRLPMHKKNRTLVSALDSLLEKIFESSENLVDTP